MKKQILLAIGLSCLSTSYAADVTPGYTMTIDAALKGIEISPTLYGIFFEDINQSNDGGISAQMIQNNSFQMYRVEGAQAKEFSQDETQLFGWTTVGDAADVDVRISSDRPLTTFPKYYDFDPADQYDDALKYVQYCAKVTIRNAGAKTSNAPGVPQGCGLAANGFGISPSGNERAGFYYSNNTQVPSLAVVAGTKYDLALYLCGDDYKGAVSVYLEDKNGAVNSNIVTLKGLKSDWKKFSGSLKAKTTADSRLVITGRTVGTFYLDFVTLVPEKKALWHGGRAGALRKDLMDALEAMQPKFMRFPGGCASEGSNYWGQYFWKNTVGPIEERVGVRNHWGTWTSQHIGFFEYFKIAEELGATPLPVLCNGVTCQFAGRSYIAPIETEADRQRFYNIWVKDALDLIDFCNGDASTEWGRKRIEWGHPKPFNLKYLGIGNENSGKDFWDRFDIIYKEVRAKHPEIIVVSTAGASASGREFNANYSIIDSLYPETVVDEHYYMGDDWFYTNGDRYAPGKVRGSEGKTYDRQRPTRVFVGEFANNRTNNAYSSTLAEAAYMTSLERNSDMVVMAAYAPLLCKKGFGKWNSNLIWFDNRGLWRTSNYWYQQMFATHVGTHTLQASDVIAPDGTADTKVYTVASASDDGTLYLKAVNAEAVAKSVSISIKNASPRGYRYVQTAMHSDDLNVRNQHDNNYYSTAEGLTDFSYDEAVQPAVQATGTASDLLTLTLPANSVNVIRLDVCK